jgi:protoporphyrinogen oxidase
MAETKKSASKESQENLLIVGGGITGLAAAYLAAKAHHNVTLIEAGDEFGGLLRTFPVGGTDLECFYHHFFTHDLELHWLLKELGLQDEIVYRKTTMGIYRNKRIFDFNSPQDLLAFHAIPFLDRIRFGLSSLVLSRFLHWEKWEHLPAIDWFYRYAGQQSTDAIWAPMLKIKFGPFYDQVPAAWMIGRLRQRMGSREGREEMLGYLEGSLSVLCKTLVARLRTLEVRLHTNTPAKRLEMSKGQLTAVYSTDKKFEAQKVLFTIPTSSLHPLLTDTDERFSNQLKAIRYCGALCAVLVSKQPVSHIYWLNVADPGFPFGGVIEHTNFIDPEKYQKKHIVYLSRYFSADEEIASQGDETIKEQMLSGLRSLNPGFPGTNREDIFIFRTDTAATVCDLHFSRKIPQCKTPIKNMYIASMPHIYPDERSCNNSIRIASEACKVMELNCPTIPHGPSLSGQVAMA